MILSSRITAFCARYSLYVRQYSIPNSDHNSATSGFSVWEFLYLTKSGFLGDFFYFLWIVLIPPFSVFVSTLFIVDIPKFGPKYIFYPVIYIPVFIIFALTYLAICPSATQTFIKAIYRFYDTALRTFFEHDCPFLNKTPSPFVCRSVEGTSS